MKAWWLAAVLVPLAIAPASARTIRNVEGHFDPERSRTIRLELAPGDIHVEPSKDGHVHIWLDVRCENDAWDDCEGRAQKIRLESAAEGEVFRVEVIGMRNQDNRGLNVNARVQVPADRAFELQTMAGEIEIRGLKNDIDLDVIAGEVSLTMDERDIGSLRAKVGIGEATLWTGGERIEGDGWLGKSLVWSHGRGDARVHVGLKVGEVDVRLR
jgi:hypothetical protein